MTTITTNGIVPSPATVAAESLAAAAAAVAPVKRTAPTGVPSGCSKRLDALAALGLPCSVSRLQRGYMVEVVGIDSKTTHLVYDTVAECRAALDGVLALAKSF